MQATCERQCARASPEVVCLDLREKDVRWFDISVNHIPAVDEVDRRAQLIGPE